VDQPAVAFRTASLGLIVALAACSAPATDGPLDFLVPPERFAAAAQSVQSALQRLRGQETTPSVEEFRVALSSWRDADEAGLDQGFRGAVARAGADGAAFVMRAVDGAPFPVRVSYLRDGSFFVVAENGQTHILFRCRLSANDVVGAASVSGVNLTATLPSPGGETTVVLRLYVGSGFTVPQRSAAASSALLGGCLEHLANAGNRAVRSFAADQQAEVQATHDYYFAVEA
jgi:hypothetical protein